MSVSYKIEGKVGLIILPPPVNDLEAVKRFCEELRDIFSEILEDERVSVVAIIGGDTDGFLFSNLSGKVLDKTEKKGLSVLSPATAVAKIDCPVVVGMRGNVIGLGLELVLACDFRVADNRSQFGFPEIKYGQLPRDGGIQRLARLVGRGKAIEMILSGEMISADEASKIGLVNRIVNSKEVESVALDVAKGMASRAPVALRYAKEAVNKEMDLNLEQGLRLESDLYYLIQTTRDRTEGIRAFQDKRKAQFKGT